MSRDQLVAAFVQGWNAALKVTGEGEHQYQEEMWFELTEFLDNIPVRKRRWLRKPLVNETPNHCTDNE